MLQMVKVEGFLFAGRRLVTDELKRFTARREWATLFLVAKANAMRAASAKRGACLHRLCRRWAGLREPGRSQTRLARNRMSSSGWECSWASWTSWYWRRRRGIRWETPCRSERRKSVENRAARQPAWLVAT